MAADVIDVANNNPLAYLTWNGRRRPCEVRAEERGACEESVRWFTFLRK
jgi:hypothetical protein